MPRIAPWDPSWFDAPADAYGWLQREAPVYWCDGDPEFPYPFWILSRAADIRQVESQPEVFVSRGGVGLVAQRPDSPPMQLPDPRFAIPTLFDLNPPEHTRQRKTLSRTFSPREIAARQPQILSIARELLATINDGETFDLMRITERYPLLVVLDLLGIQRDKSNHFSRWIESVPRQAETDDPNPIAAVIEMFDFLASEIADRRAHPGDDLITELIRAEEDGHQLDDIELLGLVRTVFVAGVATTTHTAALGLRALADNPDQLKLLRETPSLVDGAAEEMLRWVTAARFKMLTTAQDVELGGQRLAEGDRMLLLYEAANRDPEQFEDPYRFDITRPNQREHLTFGWGQHVCLGAALVRLELTAFLGEVLREFARIEPAGDVEIVPGTMIHMAASVPIAMHRASP